MAAKATKKALAKPKAKATARSEQLKASQLAAAKKRAVEEEDKEQSQEPPCDTQPLSPQDKGTTLEAHKVKSEPSTKATPNQDVEGAAGTEVGDDDGQEGEEEEQEGEEDASQEEEHNGEDGPATQPAGPAAQTTTNQTLHSAQPAACPQTPTSPQQTPPPPVQSALQTPLDSAGMLAVTNLLPRLDTQQCLNALLSSLSPEQAVLMQKVLGAIPPSSTPQFQRAASVESLAAGAEALFGTNPTTPQLQHAHTDKQESQKPKLKDTKQEHVEQPPSSSSARAAAAPAPVSPAAAAPLVLTPPAEHTDKPAHRDENLVLRPALRQKPQTPDPSPTSPVMPSSVSHRTEWMRFSRLSGGTKVSKNWMEEYSAGGRSRAALFQRFVSSGCDVAQTELTLQRERTQSTSKKTIHAWRTRSELMDRYKNIHVVTAIVESKKQQGQVRAHPDCPHLEEMVQYLVCLESTAEEEQVFSDKAILAAHAQPDEAGVETLNATAFAFPSVHLALPQAPHQEPQELKEEGKGSKKRQQNKGEADKTEKESKKRHKQDWTVSMRVVFSSFVLGGKIFFF